MGGKHSGREGGARASRTARSEAALLCVALGAVLAMPVAGWLGARHTPRLLTLTGLVFMVALPLPGFAGSVPVLRGALVLMGAGAGLDGRVHERAREPGRAGVGRGGQSSFHAAFPGGCRDRARGAL